MRTLLWSAAIALLACGCRSTSGDREPRTSRTPSTARGGLQGLTPATAGNPTNAPPVLLPASGRIHAVNVGLKFVVIDYTLGGMPVMGSVVSAYRGGQKVGEIKITGPERNGFVAGDVVSGFIQPEDQVRIN